MASLVQKSLSKWIIFAVLGLFAMVSGFFLGQRQAERQQLKEHSGPMVPGEGKATI